MDNITHSLVGYTAAEVVIHSINSVKARKSGDPLSSKFQNQLRLFSILANNFPDLDLFYTSITPGKIGYLLHHRGHTHTLLAALPIALLLTFFYRLHCKLKKQTASLFQTVTLFSTCILGGFLHIFLDSWNSYGVHPFWPLENSWYYGDTVFIIEPWIWFTLAIPILFTIQKKPIRLLLFLFSLGCLSLSLWFAKGFDRSPALLAVSLIVASNSVLSFILYHLKKFNFSKASLFLTSLTFLFGILALFNFNSQKVRKTLTESAENQNVHDVILSPSPSNPFCWNYIVVGTSPKTTSENSFETYKVTRGIASVSSRVSCSETPKAMGTNQPWKGLYIKDQKEFKYLYESNCQFREFLKFARAPYWSTENGQLLFFDLRFNFRKPGSFTEITSTPEGPCSPYVPNWQSPRSDIVSLLKEAPAPAPQSPGSPRAASSPLTKIL